MLHRLPACLNVLVQRPGQATDDGRINSVSNGLSDPFHGIEVPRAGNGEASLDDVHTQLGQLPRHLMKGGRFFLIE